MTRKSPPVPMEQRSFKQDRRDQKTGAQSGQPGDADVNLREQGRHGNMRQNLTPQRSTQDR